MQSQTTYQYSFIKYLLQKISAYAQLGKLRLSSFVVFSSVIAYILASQVLGKGIQAQFILLFALSGLLITVASNAINQILEKDLDALMDRTKNRPIPSGKVSIVEAAVFSGLAAVTGIFFLSYYFNPLTGLLGALSLITYTFIYTPFKQVSYTAVFIGAIPGAMPLLIGWTAVTNSIDSLGISLFMIQLFWQMPHFWAIAWLLDDDYKKAGFALLPYNEKSRRAALQNIPFHILLIASATIPYFMGVSGVISLIIGLLLGLFYFQRGIQLAIDLKDSSAKKLMFASFIYMSVVYLSFIIDKI